LIAVLFLVMPGWATALMLASMFGLKIVAHYVAWRHSGSEDSEVFGRARFGRDKDAAKRAGLRGKDWTWP
jgi:hypothetical protein